MVCLCLRINDGVHIVCLYAYARACYFYCINYVAARRISIILSRGARAVLFNHLYPIRATVPDAPHPPPSPRAQGRIYKARAQNGRTVFFAPAPPFPRLYKC